MVGEIEFFIGVLFIVFVLVGYFYNYIFFFFFLRVIVEDLLMWEEKYGEML